MSMIGLPPHYRVTVKNETGQTLAIGAVTVTAKRAKFASDGSLSYEGSETTLLFNAGTIANGGYATGSTITNTTDKYLSGDGLLTVTAPASSSGLVIAYLERSTDGGTTWDTAGLGPALASIYFSGAGTQRVGFSL